MTPYNAEPKGPPLDSSSRDLKGVSVGRGVHLDTRYRLNYHLMLKGTDAIGVPTPNLGIEVLLIFLENYVACYFADNNRTWIV